MHWIVLKPKHGKRNRKHRDRELEKRKAITAARRKALAQKFAKYRPGAKERQETL